MKQKRLRIIIAGSRSFNDYELLKNKLDYYLQNNNIEDVLIIEGEAKGADKLGKRYAIEKGIEYKGYPADWNKYGKGAGFKRNREMAQNANFCIIFWDGESKGTKNMIDLCQEYNLDTRIVYFNVKYPLIITIKHRDGIYKWEIKFKNQLYKSENLSHVTSLIIDSTKTLNSIVNDNIPFIEKVEIKTEGQWNKDELNQVKEFITVSLPVQLNTDNLSIADKVKIVADELTEYEYDISQQSDWYH